jgi:hypothetical protein
MDRDLSGEPVLPSAVALSPSPERASLGEEDDEAAEVAARFSSGGAGVAALLVDRGSEHFIDLVFDHLSSYGRLDLFRALPPTWRGRAFQHLRSSEQSIVFDECTVPECERLLGALAPAQRSEALLSMTQGAVEKVLHLLTTGEKVATATQRMFKEGTVGAIMHHVPPGAVVECAATVGAVVARLGAALADPAPAAAPGAPPPPPPRAPPLPTENTSTSLCRRAATRRAAEAAAPPPPQTAGATATCSTRDPQGTSAASENKGPRGGAGGQHCVTHTRSPSAPRGPSSSSGVGGAGKEGAASGSRGSHDSAFPRAASNAASDARRAASS